MKYIQADIIETERLLVRKLTNDDFDTLLTIMSKPEVMYAWEHGFSEDDVQDWIERQLVQSVILVSENAPYHDIQLKSRCPYWPQCA